MMKTTTPTPANEVSLFKFKDAEVRVVKLEGKPWFVTKDCMNVLALTNTTMALRRLSEDEVHFTIIDVNHLKATRKLRHSLVSESGLYKLVLRSSKPEARDFQNWVTKVVLPAIRKDGGYIHGEEHVVSGAMSEDELKLAPSQTSGRLKHTNGHYTP